MCNAFAAIVLKTGEVYWEMGLDSHEDLIEKFKLNELDTQLGIIHRIEINPIDMDYLYPEHAWKFEHNDEVPQWWNDKYKDLCFKEFGKWKKKVYSLINLEEARNPINPFSIKSPKKITEEHIKLLSEWNSAKNSAKDLVGDLVWNLVGDSIWNLVWNSVWNLVWNPVRNLVGNSAKDSVEDSAKNSVWAYSGSLFKLPEWEKSYPYKAVVDLWKMGLVSSFDGRISRLHGLKDGKVQVLWEGKV